MTKTIDCTDEINKESSEDSSKDNARIMDLSDRVVEALEEENDTEGEIGLFYNEVPNAEELSSEDDACYESCEDHN